MKYQDRERHEREWNHQFLRPEIRIIVLAMDGYARLKYGRELEVTCIHRTEQEERDIGAKSRTHSTGRAVDLSGRGWKQPEMEDVKRFVEGAIAARLGKNAEQAIVVVKPHGTGKHFHVQVPYYRIEHNSRVKKQQLEWRVDERVS